MSRVKKIILPTDWNEVTIDQYREVWKVYERETEAYNAVRRAIEVFAGLEQGELQHAEWTSIEKSASIIHWFLQEPDASTMKMPLQPTITHKGKRYGFIPDWTKLTVGEFADLESYCQGGTFDNLHKIMAVLYREICLETTAGYEIALYDVDKKRQEDMRQLTMDVAMSALVFFCNIEKELAITMRRSLKPKDQQKQEALVQNGDGTQSSTN